VKLYRLLDRLVNDANPTLPRMIRRLRALLRRPGLENDMQSEMLDHIERATARYAARGMSIDEARLAARREFGNVAVLQEEARDARGTQWVEAFANDIRFAFRYFARHRVTVAIIVAVLALGTGTNTIIFSGFRAAFFRAPPGMSYDADQARLWGTERQTRQGRWQVRDFTYAELTALASRRDVFADVTGFATQEVVVGGRDGTEARARTAQFVTSNFFNSLRISLAAGQGFAPVADERVGADLTAVISHSMAASLFGDDAKALGRSILVNDVSLRVIGVVPARFQGAVRDMDGNPAVWIPVSARALVGKLPERWLNETASLMVVTKLAPGVSRDNATSIVQQVVTSTMPDSAARVGMARNAVVFEMNALPPGDDREDLVMVFGLIGLGGMLLLLIGWMNVSSLMVAAAVGRRHEIAVRLSLGASRQRVLRQLITESTLLSLVGGTLGLALAWAGHLWLRSKLSTVNIVLDVPTLVFALGLAIVTGVLFGLSPALHATRGAVADAVRASGAGTTSQSRLQRTFVAAQIALSQPLLVVLGATLVAAIAEYKPFAPELRRHMIEVSVRPFSTVADTLPQFLMQHPNVTGAAPYSASIDQGWIVPPVGPRGVVNLRGAAPGWFDVAGVPILAGRDVQLADTTGTKAIPVVIGSDFAKAVWGDASPIGRTLGAPELRNMQDAEMTMTVVGVYDATQRIPGTSFQAPSETPTFRAFTARDKKWSRNSVLVRTRPAGQPMIDDLRQLIRSRAPSLPITRIMTFEQIDADQYAESVAVSFLMGGCGIFALLLSSLGLYGVVSLAVQQRTREIGIRIAVGANPNRVTRMFLKSGVRVCAVALLIGLPLSMFALRMAESEGLLIGPGINVWLIGAGIAIMLVGVAAGATWVPARRASRVDPALTLRAD
jgi:putative ABC transport system permease protein